MSMPTEKSVCVWMRPCATWFQVLSLLGLALAACLLAIPTGVQAQGSRSTAPLSIEDCAFTRNPWPPTDQYELVKEHALRGIRYFDAGCGDFDAAQRANGRQVHQQRYAKAVTACVQAGGNNCDPAASSNSSADGQLTHQACESMKQSVIATKVPANASITASQETVMFLLKTTLDMIAADCPVERGVTASQIDAERRLRQQQYVAAESACNAVQSGGRRCVPTNHFGPGATPGAGLRSADPNIPVPKPIRR